ncbi:hypothetical protein AUK14_00005 [Candidatus Berkelbacteria bacterium CG2_30_39_44]|uniref:Uncharacterized protein n=1 Tax=Candidatus Berkelbacteria bacterium CG03_land_8_20_14_0_80_40_36 TaxID=1974509 RepID=A0A2M7CIK9_9BACT|nr:MAG: hypothetical protein AUK14_00005 [Candidatus Berkelbacteria bacterium CG2_30_39_44]PIV25476.1 MAG: hypothetical protein COS38_01570 [Candidatus Berkelbacteria bacterium CG03_land_8_20_14_0_80_40_36]PIZ28829.1 MAG: hypothetical protein COY44_02115 [Candidatus Berkelbacteria bacterium CG_4_10_14_0_8_um_filter_39_42]
MNETPIDCRASRDRTKTERSGGQKGRGLGGRNPVSWHGTSFCPPSLSPLLFPPPPNFVPVKLARRPKLAVSKIYKKHAYLNYKFSRLYCFCKFICLTNIYPF